jgi:hypothetical protein
MLYCPDKTFSITFPPGRLFVLRSPAEGRQQKLPQFLICHCGNEVAKGMMIATKKGFLPDISDSFPLMPAPCFGGSAARVTRHKSLGRFIK